MRSILIVVQILTSICLVLAVLLHSAKGEGLGGIGSSARMFGTPKGLEEGLDRITTGLAITFVVVSLILGVTR